jgi:hypothetical protein
MKKSGEGVAVVDCYVIGLQYANLATNTVKVFERLSNKVWWDYLITV